MNATGVLLPDVKMCLFRQIALPLRLEKTSEAESQGDFG
jgi:hypothetical protein